MGKKMRNVAEVRLLGADAAMQRHDRTCHYKCSEAKVRERDGAGKASKQEDVGVSHGEKEKYGKRWKKRNERVIRPLLREMGKEQLLGEEGSQLREGVHLSPMS